MSIEVGGRAYSGRWVCVSSPGAISLVSASATNGFHTAYGSGTALEVPGGGSGSIILSAPDGSIIHCAFTYSQWSRTGAGSCRDNQGHTYDLQIS